MPQFAFSATDRSRNTVEGRVAAADMMLAADQIREMGYTPVNVVLVANPDIAPEPARDAAAGRVAPTRPAAFDLTQTVTEYPAAANALLATLSGPGGNETEILQPWERTNTQQQTPNTNHGEETEILQPWERTNTQYQTPNTNHAEEPEMLQPWERGGRIAAAEAAPLLDGPAAMSHPRHGAPTGAPITQSMAAVGNGVTQPMHAPPNVERPGAGRGRSPYSGRARETGVYERFKEVFIYPIRSGVVVKDLAAFYRQFATLIDAGLPIYQALVALESNTQNSKLKEIARAGQRQVQAGGRFSDVMASNPWIFPPMQVEMIRAAEQGGMLDDMLRDVAGYVEHELSMRRLIKAETMYPKLVMFMALMILGRPGIFDAMPAFSKLIIGSMGKLEYTSNNYLADTVGFALMWLGPIFAAVVIFRLFLFNTPGVREAYDTFKTNIPGLGGLIRMFVVAKFLRVYASLYSAGFGMTSILQIAGDSCGNVLLRNAAQSAIPHVERGGLVSDALARSGFLPPMAVNMFRTGETTGGMDQLLSKMADHYEAEARSSAHQMALIFSTGVFLLVATLVGFAVIRFWMGVGSSISSQAGAEQ